MKFQRLTKNGIQVLVENFDFEILIGETLSESDSQATCIRVCVSSSSKKTREVKKYEPLSRKIKNNLKNTFVSIKITIL